MAKLFGKNIVPACCYCRHGRANPEGDRIFCQKKGIMDAADYCRKFEYDPLKRSPKKNRIDDEYTQKDFSL